MTKNSKLIKSALIVFCLIILAVSWRVINYNYHVAPNLEIVTVVTVIAALSLGFRAGLIVPIATMIISDVIIGNSSIFMFTWGSFAVIGLLASLLTILNNRPKFQLVSSFGFAAVSSFIFFLVTNFGVWIQGWYPATLDGLILSYTMAIPFYKTMLIGNLILIPSAVAIFQFVKNRQHSENLVINPLVRQ